jgi:hypothetical protein
VGSRGSLRVILDRESGYVECGQTLNHIVVQAHMAHDDLPKASRGLNNTVSGSFDREPMVLGRDLHLARGSIEYRLVNSAVSVFQLVGIKTERSTQELVPKTNPKKGQPVPQCAAKQGHVVVTRGRITGPIGVEQGDRVKDATSP